MINFLKSHKASNVQRRVLDKNKLITLKKDLCELGKLGLSVPFIDEGAGKNSSFLSNNLNEVVTELKNRKLECDTFSRKTEFYSLMVHESHKFKESDVYGEG